MTFLWYCEQSDRFEISKNNSGGGGGGDVEDWMMESNGSMMWVGDNYLNAKIVYDILKSLGHKSCILWDMCGCAKNCEYCIMTDADIHDKNFATQKNAQNLPK